MCENIGEKTLHDYEVRCIRIAFVFPLYAEASRKKMRDQKCDDVKLCQGDSTSCALIDICTCERTTSYIMMSAHINVGLNPALLPTASTALDTSQTLC